ncbi:DUF5133 domain-containing protein [Streptomyces sp. RM72]|uniref:DUF5133 domain-containing protein n=1 Tax=unclassified Streptomyces TaxID=2593676 RepID=UPI000EF5BBAC|nr:MULTISPECIES: DUF5133 domain-containing protein [unclassified Streptomyces]MBQ0886511.1 DUF5133 domain-containing protein [Streptomyces sp. RM72]
MLMPHPAVLRRLLAEYEAAAVDEPADATGRPGPRTRDLEYTLCVSTGTRDVRRALETARRHLADASAPGPQPVPGGAHAGVAD